MIDFTSAPDGTSSFKSNTPAEDFFDAPVAQPESSGEIPPFIDGLNEKQKEAVLNIDGPQIVLAGAGSGKTKMLTARMAYLIGCCGVPAQNILAVTFTNKAAAEMKQRVLNILSDPFFQSRSFWGTPLIGTFHSICVRILRSELEFTPFDKPFVIYDDSDQRTLIKSVMKNLDIDIKKVNPKSIQAAINKAKCDALEPSEIEPSPFSPFEKQFVKVYEQYQKELFRNQALDFGEILCMTYRLLRDHAAIREKYQKQFRYIHVDEYQDTNRAQYLLLSILATKKHGGHENFCVVGDEDQSIYKWRGADIQNILDFEKDFSKAKTVKLEQNYRSTQNVISAASHVISHNQNRKDKKLWTDNEQGDLITKYQVQDEKAEAEVVIAEIKKRSLDGFSFDEMAVFYRTHAQSRQFEDILRREKINYQIVGGLRFYDRKEIKDILSYFKFIVNSSDGISFKRIINTPARGIGKTTIDKLDEMILNGEAKDHWDLLEKIADGKIAVTPRIKKKLMDFTKMVRGWMEDSGQILVSEIYHKVLDETGYVTLLKKEGTDEALTRIENLEEFDTLLMEFEEEYFKNVSEGEREKARENLLSQFIEQVSLASEVDSKVELSSIKLMTLHGAKGLEFPVVFMVGLEEGLFPSHRPWEEVDEEEIEEERRLCYVGMTRAKKKLFLLHAVTRRLYGQFSYQDPSRFFNEMPAEYIEEKNLAYSIKQESSYESKQQFKSSEKYDYAYDNPYEKWVGKKISHPAYGVGTVLLFEGADPNVKVTIEFKGRVRKKFLYRFIEKFLDV